MKNAMIAGVLLLFGFSAKAQVVHGVPPRPGLEYTIGSGEGLLVKVGDGRLIGYVCNDSYGQSAILKVFRGEINFLTSYRGTYVNGTHWFFISSGNPPTRRNTPWLSPSYFFKVTCSPTGSEVNYRSCEVAKSNQQGHSHYFVTRDGRRHVDRILNDTYMQAYRDCMNAQAQGLCTCHSRPPTASDQPHTCSVATGSQIGLGGSETYYFATKDHGRLSFAGGRASYGDAYKDCKAAEANEVCRCIANPQPTH